MDLKEIELLGEDIGDHWYFCSKVRAVSWFLQDKRPHSILDVGAGSAFFSRYLLETTEVVEAFCVDINYKSNADDLCRGKPIYFRKSIDSSHADLVLLMDVMEHVSDDVAFLKEYVQKVALGTDFLISVPAFNFLWSSHDDFLEHKRRYSLRQLKDVVEKSGLQIVKGRYYFGFLFPVVVAIRLFEKVKSAGKIKKSQLKRHGAILNYLLRSICLLEIAFLEFNRYYGLTVFCMARRIE